MCVKALVDAWWDGWSWFNRREIKRDLESVACKMAARIQSRDFFLSLQRARAEAGLREEGGGKIDKRWWKI